MLQAPLIEAPSIVFFPHWSFFNGLGATGNITHMIACATHTHEGFTEPVGGKPHEKKPELNSEGLGEGNWTLSKTLQPQMLHVHF